MASHAIEHKCANGRLILCLHCGTDSTALVTWINTVKVRCLETGHVEVAMMMIGHVFFHAPSDPSGLWIHRSIAQVLNEKDAGDVRRGFFTEVINSRGVFHATGGRAEKSIADSYRKKADAVEVEGFSRFATTLREVAISYDRDAERQASERSGDD